MSDNINLNLEDIARRCKLFDKADCNFVISLINKLKSQYNENELVLIYDYMLSKSSDPDVLMHLIRIVNEYRQTSSLAYLTDILLLKNIKCLNEESKEKFINVRIMCAKTIGNIKNEQSVNPLLYCLNNKNENYRVRLACADALGHIGNKYAVAPLIEVAKDEEEKSVYLREEAVFALGLLGDSRALDTLVHILETKRGIMDKFSFLKERAIEALNKIGINENERVFKALKSSLSDESPQVRIDAIEALMDSGHQHAYDTIKNVLKTDEDEEVKKNALIALYNLSDRSILDEVMTSDKYSDTLKMSAIEIINEYESEENEYE